MSNSFYAPPLSTYPRNMHAKLRSSSFIMWSILVTLFMKIETTQTSISVYNIFSWQHFKLKLHIYSELVLELEPNSLHVETTNQTVFDYSKKK